MYHIELRQFPHNFCHFNMTAEQLRASVLRAWVSGEWFELGERKWNPAQANLTVLEGPQIPLDRLSIGRGWRTALRHGKDVTEQLLASEQDLLDGSADAQPVSAPVASVTEQQPVDQALAGSLLALLGSDPAPLMRAWQIALESHPDRPPSECLALAEDLVRR